MANSHSVNTSLAAIFLVPLLPFIRSLSAVAISETGNLAIVFAIVKSADYCQQSSSVVNCSSFPRRIQIQVNPLFPSVSGTVGGNGYLCIVSSSYNSSNSDMCWQWKGFNYSGDGNVSPNDAAGENGLSVVRLVRCLGSARNVFDQMPKRSLGLVGAVFHYISFNWENVKGGRPRDEYASVALGKNRSCTIVRLQTMLCWGENGFNFPGLLRNQSFFAIEANRSDVGTSNTLSCWRNEVFDSDTMMVFKMGKKWSSKMVAIMVVVSLSSLLVFLCIYFFFRCIMIIYDRSHVRRRIMIRDDGSHEWRHLEEGSETETPQSQPTSRENLSHLINIGNGGEIEEFPLEVLVKVTDNFSEELKIGSGSFGSVYHATLDDGRHVAIKRAEISASISDAGAIQRRQENNDNAFLSELESLSALSHLNHKNLIRLLGYCADSNESLLVYEYMDNGSLYDHLHTLQSSALKSWPRRIKVALDVARGIEYLHEYIVPHVLHRDIKSSNILFDAAWTAKLSDFGLSLISPQPDQPVRAAGTVGYLDPEYYRLQLLTTKSDVYSFGVVLLELLSGRRAIHRNESGAPRNVVDYVVPYMINDEVHGVFDPHMINDEIHKVLDRNVPPPTWFEMEAVAYVGYLAADCVMLEGRDRPTMREVVDCLGRALEACMAPLVLPRPTTRSSK